MKNVSYESYMLINGNQNQVFYSTKKAKDLTSLANRLNRRIRTENLIAVKTSNSRESEQKNIPEASFLTKVTLLGYKVDESEKVSNDQSNLPTIDCTDLIGTYTMDQIPDLMKKLDEKIKKVKNIGLVLIKDVEMSERLKNNLLRNDFDTLQEVSTQTPTQMLSLEGMGFGCLKELTAILKDYNLSLKQ